MRPQRNRPSPLTLSESLICLLVFGTFACQAVDKAEDNVQEYHQIWLPYVVKGANWWKPNPGNTWQIQYAGEIDLTLDVEIYNLDLFETTPQEIDALHSRGIFVICYLNAGAWEDWRPDQASFPEVVLGEDYADWPGEKWLDIRQIELLSPIITARLDICKEKGFDGIDPDNLDGYTNPTGFPLTYEDQILFNRWLAKEAHQRELAIGLKNDPEQVEDLKADFDYVVTESCFSMDECELYLPFIDAGKPVFAIEYTDDGMNLNDFCEEAIGFGFDAILKNRALNAWLAACPQKTSDL